MLFSYRAQEWHYILLALDLVWAIKNTTKEMKDTATHHREVRFHGNLSIADIRIKNKNKNIKEKKITKKIGKHTIQTPVRRNALHARHCLALHWPAHTLQRRGTDWRAMRRLVSLGTLALLVFVARFLRELILKGDSSISKHGFFVGLFIHLRLLISPFLICSFNYSR